MFKNYYFNQGCGYRGRPGPGRPGLRGLLGGGRCQRRRRQGYPSGPGRRQERGNSMTNGPPQCSMRLGDVMALFTQGQGNPQLRLQRCMCVKQCMGNRRRDDDDDDDDDDEEEEEERRRGNDSDSNDSDDDDSEDEFCDDSDDE